ncbi:hypothetical protein [Candidatus Chromulinivorax destructor]|uniref:Transposase n=1 Tax=Candidatus Chromulinivorax destructor TaxID=2066483 RepID=A0A345ZAS3_9BACT|nr:hypothetical protein [Candidatus Chromulinivorax destructor]AXK60390.1 hypothetical protein C0J27_01320 [Candidatus Chromulinivorax destructor]
MNFSYEQIIPKKYLIPQILLQEFLNFIAQNMPSKKLADLKKIMKALIAGMYYLLRTGCQ